jgi:hypothetical protein
VGKHRVCPLICKHGFKVDGDDCVKIVCDSGMEVGDDNTCERVVTKKPIAARERGRDPVNSRRAGSSGSKCFSFNGRSYCQ